MKLVKVGIYENDNEYYTPLADNLELMKERNQLLRENIELKNKLVDLEKTTGDLDDIKSIVGYSDLRTISNKLLLPFKKELDCSVSKNGCIVYPDTNGKSYKVNLVKFRKWYLANFNKIHVG